MYARLTQTSEGRKPPIIDDLNFRIFCFGSDRNAPAMIDLTPSEERTYFYYTKGYSVEAIANRLNVGPKRVREILDRLRLKRWLR